jgi:hypothetical protein
VSSSARGDPANAGGGLLARALQRSYELVWRLPPAGLRGAWRPLVLVIGLACIWSAISVLFASRRRRSSRSTGSNRPAKEAYFPPSPELLPKAERPGWTEGADSAGAQSAWERPAPFRVSRGSSTLAWTEPHTEGAGRPVPQYRCPWPHLPWPGRAPRHHLGSGPRPAGLERAQERPPPSGTPTVRVSHPQWPALRATPTRWSRHRFDQRLGWRRVIARGDPSGPREHANRHFTDRPVLFGHPGATRIPGEHQRHLPPNPARPRCARARRRTPTAAPCAATPAGIPAQLDACMS